MKRLSGIRRPSKREVALLAQALGAILRVRLHLVRGTHHALRRMIEAHPLPENAPNEAPRADLAEIAWSVRNAARLVPGATCLTQASAGQWLLARRGHISTIRLSVPGSSEKPGTLAPHAWLISGQTIVLGGTVADYARHRPLHDFTLPGALSADTPAT
jgi:hypothetical protein